MTAAPERILVVDDKFEIREVCRKILVSEGFEVETAEDGLAGWEIFDEKRDFAAALIDMKMPRMGGLELVEKIHAVDEDIVLFIITAYATIESAVEATKRGAYRYIPKPFTPDEVLFALRGGLEIRALSLEAKRLRRERGSRLLELSFERSRCRTIIKCMTDGVFVVNRENQVVLRNQALERMIEGCEGLPTPCPLRDFACSDLVEPLEEALSAASGPAIVSREIPLGGRTYMVNVSPVIEMDDQATAAVVVMSDVTEIKKLETAKSMFVSMVAHEVKRPLGVIEGNINLILSGYAPDEEKRTELLQRSFHRARTLRLMVSELMNLSAVETGHFSLHRKPLDPTALVVETLESYRGMAEEKGIELSLDQDEGPRGRVLADRDALATILGNLIDNAVKYTPEKGHVRVQLSETPQQMIITVRDDGIGMEPEEKERIFEEFFRIRNKTTARIPGTGLGLSLVKRLVEMHQGKITVETAPGEGSTFILSLPKRSVEENASPAE